LLNGEAKQTLYFRGRTERNSHVAFEEACCPQRMTFEDIGFDRNRRAPKLIENRPCGRYPRRRRQLQDSTRHRMGLLPGH
jgi:hypothetical protein